MMYEDRKMKFVIYDGEIHMGKVFFHKDLLPDDYEKSKVFGGGIFEIRDDTLIFKGESHDFGKFNEEMVLTLPIVRNRSISSYKRIIE